MMSGNIEQGSIRVIGKVKWFNQFKGYGFVEVDGLADDAFLHFSVAIESGVEKLNNNDIIECEMEISDKGYRITYIIGILQMNKYEISDAEPQKVVTTVKWFNPTKGFGFAQMPSGEDVFIHSRLLRKHRIATLEQGSPLTLLVRRTNLGYDALDLIVKRELSRNL
jgi:CspA family cold shock protein